MSREVVCNFSDDSVFSQVLEKYGGETYLKENFPMILEMLYNTQEWHKSMKEAIIPETRGYVDDYSIIQLILSGTTENSNQIAGLMAQSSMSMVDKQSMLMMSSKTYDPKEGHTFGAYSAYVENEYQFQKGLTIDSSYLKYCKEPSVLTETEFWAFGMVDGKNVCTAGITKSQKIDLLKLTSIPFRIIVNHPRPSNESDDYIRVVYNGRQDDYAIYNFKKATHTTDTAIRYVTTYYPFSIVVQLSDEFRFDPEKPVSFDNNFHVSLASNTVQGGVVKFNTGYWDKIKTSVINNSLTLSFDYNGETQDSYWGVDMPLTAKQYEGHFDFHLNFTINYGKKNEEEYDLRSAIIVTSNELPQSDNLVKIKQSRIMWGCLGKDTIIRTKDGYKKISQLQHGEELFTDKGYLRLKNMVTGTEEEIIAVGVSEAQTLYITKNHPIATQRGIIEALDLSSGDMLQLEDGSFKPIYYLDILPYSDKVYSPELEEPALIAAEGIMVGDYMTPVSVVPEKEKEVEPLSSGLVDELKRWSALKNEQLQKEVTI